MTGPDPTNPAPISPASIRPAPIRPAPISPAPTGTSPAPIGDRIVLTGLRAYGRHGVYPHERRDGQEFSVDVVLWLDLAPAAASDDVVDTVHYGELADRLVAIIGGEPVNLIETLADRLARACLADRRVKAVTVTVHKPHAPVPHPFDDIAVTLHRTVGS